MYRKLFHWAFFIKLNKNSTTKSQYDVLDTLNWTVAQHVLVLILCGPLQVLLWEFLRAPKNRWCHKKYLISSICRISARKNWILSLYITKTHLDLSKYVLVQQYTLLQYINTPTTILYAPQAVAKFASAYRWKFTETKKCLSDM